MKEKDFQVKFKNWINKNKDKFYLNGNCSFAFELKIEKTNKFNFNRVSKNQIDSLFNARHSTLYYKINDLPIYAGSRTRFCNPKPFDCIVLCYCESYIVLWFYKPRKKKIMYWIKIDNFILERLRSLNKGEKSWTEEKIKNIATMEHEFK